MKTKIYLFRLVVAVMTLTLGVGVYFIWQFLTAQTVSDISQLEKTVSEIEKVQPMTEINKTEDDLPATEETVEDEFDAEGNYYLIGDLPKDFKDFYSLSVITSNYEVKDDGSAYASPIPPEIELYSKIKYKFTRININNRQISFETEGKNGISFQFTGYFPEQYEDEKSKEWVSLEGTLTKLKNGKKVAETQAKFGYIHGCQH